MVLSGPDSGKYLLPTTWYADYNLQSRSEVHCKVDKINCSGKVFLEPQHPFYTEGKYYDFKVTSSGSGYDKAGTKTELYIAEDIMGKEVSFPASIAPGKIEPGQKVNLRIERISKGRLFFSPLPVNTEADKLEEGKTYDFIIKRIEKNPDGDDFFVASDPFGNEHLLNTRYYGHYGFNEGASFRGKVIRYSAGKPKTIEPENPWYKPGDIVEVTVAGVCPLETGEGYTTEVFDTKGFRHEIIIPHEPLTASLRCRVLKMKKGRPVFEVLS